MELAEPEDMGMVGKGERLKEDRSGADSFEGDRVTGGIAEVDKFEEDRLREDRAETDRAM